MHPRFHILAGIALVILLHFLSPQVSLLYLSIIFFSSWLIDVDHYFYYIMKERNFNLIKCYKWYRLHLNETLALPMSERKKRYTGFYMFHGIEPLIILFLLGISVSPFLLLVFFGFSFHMLVDIPSEIIVKRTFQKGSLIYNYTQFRKIERHKK